MEKPCVGMSRAVQTYSEGITGCDYEGSTQVFAVSVWLNKNRKTQLHQLQVREWSPKKRKVAQDEP